MTTHENGSGSDHVQALVAQREQLRAWIARLDEVQGGAPSRVAERVRADYQARLQRVDEELSAHGEEIQRNLEALRGQLDAAEERRAHAGDALDETQLRHLIGELDDAQWEQARAPLERDVAEADAAVTQARGEVERLSALAEGIVGGAAARELAGEPAPATASNPESETRFSAGDIVVEEVIDEDEDLGGDLPFLAPDEPAAADTGAADDGGIGAWEPELELAGGASAPSAPAAPAANAGAPSGEELAAWISEVESESSTGGAEETQADASPAPAAPAADDVDGWDPFADEFGGSPASPATQPGDAAQDLPWLSSLQGGAAGQWAQPAATPDELAFLDNLDTSAPAPAANAQPAADLAADDLAFLEELDRAISGGSGSQRAAQPAAGGLGNGFQGGSGASLSGAGESTQEQPRKRGEALLCKECGAINEPQAWYCEICGSEL